MRRAWLLLAVVLAGCSKPAPAPAPSSSSNPVALAQEAYRHKDWKTARAEALKDPTPPMQLLAAKAAARSHDNATAYGELNALARTKHIDAEGRHLMTASQQAGLKQADTAFNQAHGDLKALNAVLTSYQTYGATGSRQAAVYGEMARYYEKSGNMFEAREQLGRAIKADPGNPVYPRMLARDTQQQRPAQTVSAPTAPSAPPQNPADNASEILHTHHAWQGQ